MSAAEVIEQFNLLPSSEQEKVVDYVRRCAAKAVTEKPDHQVSEEFKRIADEVFTTNAELFRKLAQ
jgi:hypothetical protein